MALMDAASAQIAETYTLTDITGWTSNQLAALPWFAHWMPLMPPGAPPNFSAAARNAAGAVVGEAAGYYPIPDRGAVVENGTTTYIAAWGNHPWGYWSCDSHDCHYFWGTVEHSPATDVNAAGLAVGHATIATPFSSSSLDFIEHAYLFDPATGLKTDLTPDGVSYDRAYRINDHGVIIGNYSGASNYLAYRREPDGTMNFFTHPTATVQPMVLNNAGLVAGIHTTYTVSNRIVVPWIASNTTVMTPASRSTPMSLPRVRRSSRNTARTSAGKNCNKFSRTRTVCVIPAKSFLTRPRWGRRSSRIQSRRGNSPRTASRCSCIRFT